ncbi:hypothetical protein SAMN05446935_6119 [Burkholderia sp. YR290]|nr:hypothetical protein SAMN05446935_6119 [Burkholderia sp. YR290]
MAERAFRVGNREFRIVSVAHAGGGFRARIIRITYASEVMETRVEIGIRHQSEEEALDAGERTARLMAEEIRD